MDYNQSSKEQQPKKNIEINFVMLLIIIIILGFTIGLGTSFVLKSKYLVNDKQNDNNEGEKITNTTIIDKLKKNYKILNTTVVNGEYILPNIYKQDNLSEIPDNIKLLLSFFNTKESDVPTNMIHNFLEETYDPEELSYITAKDFEKTYYQIFPKEDKINIVPTTSCPTIWYSAESNGYFVYYACGGDKKEYHYNFFYNYTRYNNEYYIYVAVGYSTIDDISTDNEEQTTEIHTSYINNETFFTDLSPTEFKINKDNYKSFDHFKYTFVRTDNNFIFKSIEKINDSK